MHGLLPDMVWRLGIIGSTIPKTWGKSGAMEPFLLYSTGALQESFQASSVPSVSPPVVPTKWGLHLSMRTYDVVLDHSSAADRRK